MRNNSKEKSRGFTLIESLLAIFIFSVSLVALVTVTSRGITGGVQARDQAVAQFLAQEGIERMRNLRDSQYIDNPQVNWLDKINPACSGSNNPCAIAYGQNQLLVPADTGLIRNPSDNRYDAVPEVSGKFTRHIFYKPLDPPNPTEIEIHSVVSWNNGTIPREVRLKSTLRDWIE